MSCSHSDFTEDSVPVRRDAVSLGKWFPTCLRNIVSSVFFHLNEHDGCTTRCITIGSLRALLNVVNSLFMCH
jgi:hypothetical protein